MMTAKIFENGRSQAVRLPKEFRFDDSEVAINRVGEIVMLIPKNNKWNSFIQAIEMFSDDYFITGRGEDEHQDREKL